MITKSKRLSVAVAAAGFSATIYADFDQWRISEIFTSADALVQYVELETTAANQGELAGLSLLASDAAGQLQNTATIANDLSADTSNRNFLIATNRLSQ
jgi:hypothetical protein